VVGAISAGCTAILKPSPYTPNVAMIMEEMIAEFFEPEYLTIVQGSRKVNEMLLEQRFDFIFFTGSPQVGKIVMRAAAEHLASVTLELGGKSPVIVEESADLDAAAAKIIWLKLINAGQTCIAPDYVLVHESVQEELLAKMKSKIHQFYGNSAEDIQQSPDLCRIVHFRQFERVKALLDDATQRGATLVTGGQTVEKDLYIAPTILTKVPQEAKIWEEEIFGPLLLVRGYQTMEQAIGYINAHPKPLSMYVFSANDKQISHIIAETRCGGVTVNDCGPHFYNPELPFGGSNNSGLGKCHGEFGFLEFTNQRGVLYQARWKPNTDFFLPPYGGKLRQWLLEGVVKWF